MKDQPTSAPPARPGSQLPRPTLLSAAIAARRSSGHPSPPHLGRAPGRPAVTRRRLRLALAFLWLLDGVLQLQPFMFTRGFADRVIAPAADGQPAFVAAAVHWAAAVILGHPAMYDALFATVQLAIGAALLFRPTARLAIVASITWSLGVWTLGEGIGGLAGGTTTFLTGAPGAVVLYGLLGAAAWPRLGAEGRAALASPSARLRTRLRALCAPAGDEPPAAWVPGAWAALWGLFGLLRALPANDSARAVAAQLRTNAPSALGWVAHAERATAAAVTHDGPVPAAIMATAEVALGLLALRQGALRRAAAGVGIGLAAAVWILGQAFGQIPSGMATDPNSGPLVALLGIALLGCCRGPAQARAAAAGGERCAALPRPAEAA